MTIFWKASVLQKAESIISYVKLGANEVGAM